MNLFNRRFRYDEGVDTTFYEDLKQSFDAQAQVHNSL